MRLQFALLAFATLAVSVLSMTVDRVILGDAADKVDKVKKFYANPSSSVDERAHWSSNFALSLEAQNEDIQKTILCYLHVDGRDEMMNYLSHATGRDAVEATALLMLDSRPNQEKLHAGAARRATSNALRVLAVNPIVFNARFPNVSYGEHWLEVSDEAVASGSLPRILVCLKYAEAAAAKLDAAVFSVMRNTLLAAVSTAVDACVANKDAITLLVCLDRYAALWDEIAPKMSALFRDCCAAGKIFDVQQILARKLVTVDDIFACREYITANTTYLTDVIPKNVWNALSA